MHSKELDNGLKIVVVPRQEDQSVTVEICGLAGSAHEAEAAGAAHFLEHLLFDGTKNYPEIDKLDEIVSKKGSRKNGMTNKDFVRYFVKSLPEEIESSFLYLSEIIINPLLRSRDIDREKTIIEQEINRFKDDPSLYLPRKVYSSLYPDSPLGRFVTGDVDEVMNLNKEDIEKFWEKNYCAKNFVLVVAGDTNEEKVFNLAKKYFSKMKSGERREVITQQPNTKKVILSEQRDKLKQAHTIVNFFGPQNGSEDTYPLNVAIKILSRGFGSRLYSKLRTEKAMIYSLINYLRQFSFGGTVGIVTAFEENRLNEGLAIIKTELEKMANEEVADEELFKGISIALSDDLFNSELNEELTRIYAYNLLTTGNIVLPEESKNKYKDVSKKDVMRISGEIFLQNPKILTVTNSTLSRDIVY